VDGKIYSRLAGANRLKVSLSEVSPYFITAVLAREDTRFYEHKGIDWRGVLRALTRDVLSMSAKEGASSLTMQLARNSLPLGGRSDAARRCSGAHGCTKKNHVDAGQRSEKGKHRDTSKANSTSAGELRHGFCAARFEPDPHPRPDG